MLLRVAVLAGVTVSISFIGMSTAEAHKVTVFATVLGGLIDGDARDGSEQPIVGATVRVLDPDGGLLGQTTTDDKGAFKVPCRAHCDHRIVVDDGTGHGGECTVSADETPESLPERVEGLAIVAEDELSFLDDDHDEGLEDLTRQIAQLRKKLAEHEEKTRMQDLLGGVGYIFGIGGLAFYLGSRRKESLESRPPA